MRGESAHLVNTILTKHSTEGSKDLIQHAADLIEPATLRQAQLSTQSEQWQSAMDAELASLEDENIKITIPENELPKDCEPLGTIEELATKYSVTNTKPKHTPMEANFNLPKKQSIVSTSSCKPSRVHGRIIDCERFASHPQPPQRDDYRGAPVHRQHWSYPPR